MVPFLTVDALDSMTDWLERGRKRHEIMTNEEEKVVKIRLWILCLGKYELLLSIDDHSISKVNFCLIN